MAARRTVQGAGGKEKSFAQISAWSKHLQCRCPGRVLLAPLGGAAWNDGGFPVQIMV